MLLRTGQGVLERSFDPDAQCHHATPWPRDRCCLPFALHARLLTTSLVGCLQGHSLGACQWGCLYTSKGTCPERGNAGQLLTSVGNHCLTGSWISSQRLGSSICPYTKWPKSVRRSCGNGRGRLLDFGKCLLSLGSTVRKQRPINDYQTVIAHGGIAQWGYPPNHRSMIKS